EMLD
ncbi:Amidophosphoribosyltransferase, partial [Haemophilus influenzae]